MAASINVKIQPLSAAAFKPYGRMLEHEQPVFPDVDPGEGRVAIEVKHLTSRPDTRQMHQLASHFSYNQTYLPWQGSLVLVVAPAPRNREAGLAAFEFDYEKVAGFLIKPGQGAHIDKGVWHNSFMMGPRCICINVTRKNPGEGTTEDAGGRYEITHAKRPYIDYVDIKQRDNRLIELDLSGVAHLVER